LGIVQKKKTPERKGSTTGGKRVNPSFNPIRVESLRGGSERRVGE